MKYQYSLSKLLKGKDQACKEDGRPCALPLLEIVLLMVSRAQSEGRAAEPRDSICTSINLLIF